MNWNHFLNEWSAWITDWIIIRAFSSTSALSEALRGYQTTAEVVKKCMDLVYFFSEPPSWQQMRNLWWLLLTLQQITVSYCGKTEAMEAWSIYYIISTASLSVEINQNYSERRNPLWKEELICIINNRLTTAFRSGDATSLSCWVLQNLHHIYSICSKHYIRALYPV